MKTVNIELFGNIRTYPENTRAGYIANDYQDRYKHDIIAAIKDNKICELNKKISGDCKLDFITTDSAAGHGVYVRGVAMMLLKAINEMFPDDETASINIEATIGNGYYCEFASNEHLNETVINGLEKLMRGYVKRDITYTKTGMDTDDAIELFRKRHMKHKERLFMYRRASKINIYNLGGYEDYFYGAMPPSTGILKHFKLQMYGNGFVFIVPDEHNPDELTDFKPSPKFYNVVKEANDWIGKMDVDGVGALNDAIANGHLQELILVQEALHEKKIGDIAANIASNPGMKFVMIAGPSSSGKTTFSHRLSIQLKTLGLTPHTIPLDNYFVDREKTPLNEDGSYNYECLEAVDTERFNSDMTKLLKGKEVVLPVYNFLTGKREHTGIKKQLGSNDILVIEGIHGLNDELSYSLPSESKYKIYISALTQLNIDEHNRIPTTDGRLIRRIVRDARTRGVDAQATIAMWQSVRNGENKYIFPYQEQADVMFNSALIYELAVLKQYAEPLLFKVSRNSPEYIEARRLLKFFDYFLGAGSENVNYNSILREFIGGSIFSV